MADILRVGIIGCGGISRVHSDALLSMKNARVTAVCDVNAERLQAMADKTGAQAYANWQDVIKRGDIDIVHILTPHYLHAPMAIAALNAGIHALTEKPMATTIEDARRMIEVADKSTATLNVIFQNRYNASAAELKRLIDSGETGKLICARASVCWNRKAPYYTECDWRGTYAKEGGGALINQAIHTLDMMSYLGGPIARVKGHASTDLLAGVIEVEDNCHAVFEYEGGQTGIIHVTNNYGIDAPATLEMVFENGVYQLIAEKLFKLEDGMPVLLISGEDGKELGAKSYWGSSHKHEIALLYESILAGKQFEIDGRSAFPALCLVKSIQASSLINDWVTLEKV